MEEIAYELKDKDGQIIKTFYKGKGSGKAKGIAKANKELILEMDAAGVLRRDIAKHFGVTVSTIRKAVGPKL